ncbi:MAG: PQQ-binding-like beta-propeller repeat protein [Planctomycetes bacterium]|nr:PQQ-binding-like beta-propeller repeat protein [Planctomycetota bacterium]
MRHGVLNGVATILVVLTLVLATGCGTGSGGTPPPASGEDVAVSPVATAYRQLLPNGEELWCARLPVEAELGSLERISLGDGPDATGTRTATLYLISAKQRVVAVGENGMTRWTFGRLDLPLEFPPAEGPTAVAFLTRDKLWLVDRQSGSLLNRKTLAFTPSTPPALSRSTVYLPSLGDNRIYSVAIADGADGWRVRMNGPISAAPAMAGNIGRPTLHVATEKGTVLAFDALAASAPPPEAPLWEKSLPGAVMADLSASADGGIVFVPSHDYMLHAYRAATGESVWNYPGGRPLETPATHVGDLVFQRNADQLVALDFASGAVKWMVAGAKHAVCKWGDDYIVAGPGQKLRRIQGKDGAVLAEAERAEDFLVPDPIGGRFIVADRDWNLKVYRYRRY